MPEKGVYCHCDIGVHKTIRHKQCHESTKQIEIHQECFQWNEPSAFFHKRKYCTHVHGKTAKLKREDPPVIGMVIHDVIMKQLLVQLRDYEKYSNTKQDAAIDCFRYIAQFPGE